MHNTEIEVRFLEINKQELIDRLKALGAEDRGEELLEEIIFYDAGSGWLQEHKFVRLRESRNGLFLTYKNHAVATATGTEEIEFKVGDMQKARDFLERLGLVAARHQQKLRHSLKLDGVMFDIDTWPKIPAYVELEGESEQALKDAAKKAGLDWNRVVFENARIVIEQKYHIPVGTMKWFTFDRFE